MLKIAYIAPEIPSLSTTFIYNEILNLEDNGYKVLPLSLHTPGSLAEEKKVENLKCKTKELYNERFDEILKSFLYILFTSPIVFFRTFFILVIDSVKSGLFNRQSFGLYYRFIVSCHTARILKREKVTLIHAHFAHTPTDIAMYASLLTNIPYSFTSHANDIFQRSWLLKEKVKRSYRAVTISYYNKDVLIQRGCDADKIEVVRCGVKVKKNLNIEHNQFSEQPVKLGALGRLVEKKGIDSLIKSLSYLKDKAYSCELHIAGDGPLLEDLQQLVDKYALKSQVHFIGAINHDKVNEWMKNLDIFILPCCTDSHGDKDGIPVVLMEAISLGIPVISSNISGIPELIKDGENGFLIEEKDSYMLSQKINDMITDPDETHRKAKKAFGLLLSEFEENVNIRKLAKVFEDGIKWR